MSLKCPQLRDKFKNIKSQYDAYVLALELAKNSKEYETIFNIQKEIESGIKELKRNFYPLENLEQEQLEKQYHKQVEILMFTGLVKKLQMGEMGIVVDGKEYPIPTFDDILEKIRNNAEFLDKKALQGFTKLLVVPFGLDIATLVEKYKQVILKHHNNNTLLDSDGKPLKLDTNQPVWTWDGYQNEPLVYFPQQFDKDNHQGKTKDQLEPWQVILVEDMIDLPKEGDAKDINGRKQLDANQTPSSYLEQILQEQEQGLTPESWLLLAITYLEEQNKQIDNYQGKGKASYLPGAFFKDSAKVPVAYWRRDIRQARLYRNVAGVSDSFSAVRSSVLIE